MADVEWKMEGLDSLLKKLESVSYDVKRKGGRSALRKAAKMIADDVKRRALALDDPKSAEVIAKNVAIRWSSRRFKQTGDLGFRIGILGGARNYEAYGEISTGKKATENPGGDTFHWRFLEFGTEKKGATPFMLPALGENTHLATQIFGSEYEKALDRAIKRAGIVRGGK